MGNKDILPSREFGLIMGLIIGKFCLKMEDLHYGYWTDDLTVEVQNLPKAQAQYTEVLIGNIPEGVRTILDVGCGTGHMARKLLDRGYHVDCVSPNPHLTKLAKEKLGVQSTIFECRYQELQTDRKYDLVLFSESFLFIRPPEAGMKMSEHILNKDGYILITDVFKITPDGQSPIGGGHHLHIFHDTFSHSPFKLLKEDDITGYIAPTFTVLDDAYTHCVKPAYDLLMTRFKASHPWAMKFILWKFRAKFENIENKHFSGKRTAENFAKYKSYRLFLFQKVQANS